MGEKNNGVCFDWEPVCFYGKKKTELAHPTDFTMMRVRSWKITLAIISVLCICSIVFSIYFLHRRDKGSLPSASSSTFKSNFEAYFAGRFLQRKFQDNQVNKDFNLNLENEDVIVFLHIQKTGGTTFGKHLVENLNVNSPCNCYKRVKKHCDCLTKKKQVWLFSRYSTGWECGLHADWTELTTCVDKWFQSNYDAKRRRYHYVTLLRDPVARFVSEWMHVRRGATWKAAALRCNGRQATLEEVPFCFTGLNWEGVSLKEFMSCRHNLAFNRQTRMLANLSEVDCYSAYTNHTPHHHRLMLNSAKRNLLNLSFFGLLEFQTYTQFLFEHTLNINFIRDFEQDNFTRSSTRDLSVEELKTIAEMNYLDVELYQFAKDLFLQRVRQAYVDEDLPVPVHLQGLVVQNGEDLDSRKNQVHRRLLGNAALTKPFQKSVNSEYFHPDVPSFHHKRLVSRHPVLNKLS